MASLFETALWACASASFELLILVLLGVLATYGGVFSEQAVSDLGRLVYFVSLPALLFSRILAQFTLQRLHEMWIVPLFCCAHIFCLFLAANVLATVFRLNALERGSLQASMMFGNVGALTIAVLANLCTHEPLLSQVGPSCAARGVSLIAFYLIAQNLIMFTIGESMLVRALHAGDAASILPEGEDEAEGEAQIDARAADPEKTAAAPALAAAAAAATKEEKDNDDQLSLVVRSTTEMSTAAGPAKSDDEKDVVTSPKWKRDNLAVRVAKEESRTDESLGSPGWGFYEPIASPRDQSFDESRRDSLVDFPESTPSPLPARRGEGDTMPRRSGAVPYRVASELAFVRSGKNGGRPDSGAYGSTGRNLTERTPLQSRRRSSAGNGMAQSRGRAQSARHNKSTRRFRKQLDSGVGVFGHGYASTPPAVLSPRRQRGSRRSRGSTLLLRAIGVPPPLEKNRLAMPRKRTISSDLIVKIGSHFALHSMTGFDDFELAPIISPGVDAASDADEWVDGDGDGDGDANVDADASGTPAGQEAFSSRTAPGAPALTTTTTTAATTTSIVAVPEKGNGEGGDGDGDVPGMPDGSRRASTVSSSSIVDTIHWFWLHPPALCGSSSWMRVLRNPPIMAAVCAIIIGLLPPVQRLFVHPASSTQATVPAHSHRHVAVPATPPPAPPLEAVLEAVSVLGNAQVPVSMLMLSGSGTLRWLSELKQLSKDDNHVDHSFSRGASLLIILSRIVVGPAIGIGCWVAASHLKVVDVSDRLLGIVVMMEAAVPTAQNVVMLLLCSGFPGPGQEMAMLVLWQMAVDMVIFTIFTSYIVSVF